MLKVTKCIGVKPFVESLINMVCELKITSECKKMCKNFMVIRHSIKELLAKSMVTRPMKCTVVTIYIYIYIYTISINSFEMPVYENNFKVKNIHYMICCDVIIYLHILIEVLREA